MKNRDEEIPRLRAKKGESLKSIYARARRAFTAADLQKYTESRETLLQNSVPAEQVIAEMKAIHTEETSKTRKIRNGKSRK
jgi:hypothetical protein